MEFFSRFRNWHYPIGCGAAVVATFGAYALMISWSRRSGSNYIGIPSWNNNLFAWHPTLMVCGYFSAQVLSITSWCLQYLGASGTVAKTCHVAFQCFALVAMAAGITAILIETNSSGPVSNLVSMHSWLGVSSVVLFLHNFTFAAARELIKQSRYIQTKFPQAVENSLFYHRCLGLCTVVVTGMAILSGITLAQGDCEFTVTNYEINPALHYSDLATGCKISNGIGVCVLVAVVTLMFTLMYRWYQQQHEGTLVSTTDPNEEVTRTNLNKFYNRPSVGLIPSAPFSPEELSSEHKYTGLYA